MVLFFLFLVCQKERACLASCSKSFYGLSVSFPEKEIVVDTDLEIRIKLSAS